MPGRHASRYSGWHVVSIQLVRHSGLLLGHEPVEHDVGQYVEGFAAVFDPPCRAGMFGDDGEHAGLEPIAQVVARAVDDSVAQVVRPLDLLRRTVEVWHDLCDAMLFAPVGVLGVLRRKAFVAFLAAAFRALLRGEPCEVAFALFGLSEEFDAFFVSAAVFRVVVCHFLCSLLVLC